MNIIIKDEYIKLLAYYGAVISECNKVESYVAEIIKQKGKLLNANQKLINSLLNKFFGKKIELLSDLIDNKDLIVKLNQLNSDRVFLAHGFSLHLKDKEIHLILPLKKPFKISEESLQDIFSRACDISNSLVLMMDSPIIHL
jgi:hypothetical protein